MGFEDALALPVTDTEQARRSTDAAVAAFGEFVAASPDGAAYQRGLDGVRALNELRRDIDADTGARNLDNVATAQDAFDRYAGIAGGLLDDQQAYAATIDDPVPRSGAMAYGRGLRLDDQATQLMHISLLAVVLPGSESVADVGRLRTEVEQGLDALVAQTAGTPFADSAATVVAEVEATGPARGRRRSLGWHRQRHRHPCRRRPAGSPGLAGVPGPRRGGPGSDELTNGAATTAAEVPTLRWVSSECPLGPPQHGCWPLRSVSVAEWFSIEVFDGSSSARAWKEAYGDAVVAAAHTEGLSDWLWHGFGWGVVLEVELPDEAAWDRLLAAPAVRAALDAVPDPIGGLLVHRGRGGSSGVRWPRRPRPLAGAGAVALPEPVEQEMSVVAPQVVDLATSI